MTRIVPLPRLGELTESAVVQQWLCAVGDTVTEGDAVVEVETDKVDTEVLSPVSGRVVRLCAEEGAEVAVGDPLLEVET